ncbi:MAG TPA: ThaI family type II restriction endonuclease [Ignavibacteriaceae bacterium]|nr:ThaI family type II restriction endonuclease [Ignavibacteriaceae bacterium]
MNLSSLFSDEKIVLKVQNKLPELFQIAELESQRAGKTGMEVGSIRERIIVSLLIYKFGEENVETEIPITEPEVDVKLFGNLISIKTKSGNGFTGVKLIWTVDSENALEFQNTYKPSFDMIFVRIIWGNVGGLFYFSKKLQEEVFNLLGKEKYIKLPSKGTNPRGVEISSKALKTLVEHNETKIITINWTKKEIEFNAFKKWIDLWAQE